MVAPWRLIVDGAESGAHNMALDRALLAGRAAGTSPPTLRLYRWKRATLSLGRFQDVSAVDLSEARVRGVDVVRRPTGGRAVLHDDELTYSVVASTTDGVPRGIVGSYRFFASALVAAYRDLGVETQVANATRGQSGSASCYLASTQADLVAGACKLSGSAQVWEHGAVLQHGSFVVSRDVELEAVLLRLTAKQEALLAASTRTLADIMGSRPPIAQVEEAVVIGFESALGITLEPGTFSDVELEAARHLDKRFRVCEP
jgi:lipoate-protein ligase A